MNKSTTSLSFPDVNVWLALTLEHHVHRSPAAEWWKAAEGSIVFTRVTQISVLRLLTTSGAMDGKPISMAEAWRVYDGLFADDRVAFVPEPAEIETRFRRYTSARRASPMVWADAWLLAFAERSKGPWSPSTAALRHAAPPVCSSNPDNA
jgi:predicted nucleic acid-binding protein